MSYTTFDYKNLKINETVFAKGESVKVSVEVTNSGNYDGKKVVQLYIHDVVASLARLVKELKDFELIELEKDETKTVTLTLTDKDLSFFDNDNYLVEPELLKLWWEKALTKVWKVVLSWNKKRNTNFIDLH